MADIQQQVMLAIASLPRPVTKAQALETAKDVLDPQGLMPQFTAWFEQNGAYVLAKING